MAPLSRWLHTGLHLMLVLLLASPSNAWGSCCCTRAEIARHVASLTSHQKSGGTQGALAETLVPACCRVQKELPSCCAGKAPETCSVNHDSPTDSHDSLQSECDRCLCCSSDGHVPTVERQKTLHELHSVSPLTTVAYLDWSHTLTPQRLTQSEPIPLEHNRRQATLSVWRN